jgi:hypothetical protein
MAAKKKLTSKQYIKSIDKKKTAIDLKTGKKRLITTADKERMRFFAKSYDKKYIKYINGRTVNIEYRKGTKKQKITYIKTRSGKKRLKGSYSKPVRHKFYVARENGRIAEVVRVNKNSPNISTVRNRFRKTGSIDPKKKASFVYNAKTSNSVSIVEDKSGRFKSSKVKAFQAIYIIHGRNFDITGRSPLYQRGESQKDAMEDAERNALALLANHQGRSYDADEGEKIFSRYKHNPREDEYFIYFR